MEVLVLRFFSPAGARLGGGWGEREEGRMDTRDIFVWLISHYIAKKNVSKTDFVLSNILRNEPLCASM